MSVAQEFDLSDPVSRLVARDWCIEHEDEPGLLAVEYVIRHGLDPAMYDDVIWWHAYRESKWINTIEPCRIHSPLAHWCGMEFGRATTRHDGKTVIASYDSVEDAYADLVFAFQTLHALNELGELCPT